MIIQIIALIFSGLAAVASFCAILTFIYTRKHDSRTQIESDAVFKNEFKHLRDGVDDLRLDMRDMLKRHENMELHVSNDNIRLNNLENRVTILEKKVG